MCAAPFLIICRINRSRVLDLRHFSPRKRRRCIIQRCTFSREEREQDETRVFFLSVLREIDIMLFRVNFSSSHTGQAVYPSFGKRDSSSDTAQHFDAFFARTRIYIVYK